MSVKVLIKRKVTKSKVKELKPLLVQLRSLASQQQGYISGETLKRVDNPGTYLVISRWRSMDDWSKWLISEDRMEIQDKVDLLLGGKTDFEIYEYE